MTTQERIELKGLVYSSSRLLRILDEQFLGNENVIRYKFRASGLQVGEVVSGDIVCVTSIGEFHIPFRVTIIPPYCLTKVGEVKDLFHFTNIAKEDPATALRLFKSEEFGNVFLQKDMRYRMVYDTLLGSTSPSQAMEEFLVTIHKKMPVTIQVDKSELVYEVHKDSFMDKLTIRKDNWGYSEIRISTDAPFLRLDHKILWTDNFLGSSYPLEVVIDPSRMRKGTNYGQIILRTINQTIVIPVTCKAAKLVNEEHSENRLRKSYEMRLMNNYLNFRMNRISLESYIQDTSEILTNLSIIEDEIQFDLYRTHLYIISNNEQMASNMLENFKHRIDGSTSSALEYCSYLYLNALYSKDKQTIEAAVETIREFYSKESNFRILWFLLYLDKRYEHNKQLKLKDMKKHFEEKCTSPILYYEACAAYNNDPSLLHELGRFEQQVINWGAKNGALNRQIIVQYAYLACKEKSFQFVVYDTLRKLYQIMPDNDVLTAICSILIKSEKTECKYFDWYRLGVEAQLKLTSLHEYYMYAIDETKQITLSPPIYLYYMYNSDLSDRKRAFLYAQIIRNKFENPSVYQNYRPQMERFMLKELRARHINYNLAVIYNDLLELERIDDTVARDLSVVMYYHQILCDNRNIKGVCVVHKELENEIYQPFIDGKAEVPIFTENAQIFMVDFNDNRYCETVHYQVIQLLDADRYSELCFLFNRENPMLILNLAEKVVNYHRNTQDSIQINKLVIQVPNIQPWCYKKYLLSLIQHFYNHYDGDLLDAYLKAIDLKSLSQKERAEIIDYMILRDIQDKAMEAINRYGCYSIPTNRLHKLCLKLVAEAKERNDVLVHMCHSVFLSGKYQEPVLSYLLKYFQGSTQDMELIWSASKERELDTLGYEERLLGQILFAETSNPKRMQIFLSYYGRGENHTLIRAFLSYHAYQFLLKDISLDREIIDIMRKEIAKEPNELCTIAILRYYSSLKQLLEEEKEFADFHVNRLCNAGIILPFFKEMRGKIPLSEMICNRLYIQYRTSRDRKVMIHYRIADRSKVEENDDYFTEEMKDVYEGIHVKEFLLFNNEELHYYITLDNKEEVVIEGTESNTVSDTIQEPDTRFHMINLMITSLDMNEETTAIEVMKQYVSQNYIAKELFTPIRR
jgi:hypothetical protein